MSKYSLNDLKKFKKSKARERYELKYDETVTYFENNKITNVYFLKGHPVCERIRDYNRTWDGSGECNIYTIPINKEESDE